jgi:hypothetical protein
MLVEKEKLCNWIDKFYGYGSWNARIWFVSHEEDGGDFPEDVADKLNYFDRFHKTEPTGTLCDIRELYREATFRDDGPKSGIYVNHFDYRFGERAMPVTVWKNLISFEHGYLDWKQPDLLQYQRSIFASPEHGHEALIRLFPLPSPHNHAWYYSWLDLDLKFLRKRELYENHLYDIRLRTILDNIQKYQPQLVLMYGMNNINALKNSVSDFFNGPKFRMIKGTKLQIPQHHVTESGKTTIVITTQIPALRHNRIESGFDWQLLGKSLRGRDE